MATDVVNPGETVDYITNVVPSSYVCGNCGTTGVKLWRCYGKVLEHTYLRCVDCACTEAGIDSALIDETGMHDSGNGKTHDIGERFVPAIPSRKNDTFLKVDIINRAYDSPYHWWRSLPTHMIRT